jgi:hypothetical protein
MNNKAEEIRIRCFYRGLILQGRVMFSFESARTLVGQDCAQHLYPAVYLKKHRRSADFKS